MAKMIRFPLIMKDGIEVRSLEELRANFYLPQVIGYLQDGKLALWLEAHSEGRLAKQIRELTAKNTNLLNLSQELCKIFAVPMDRDSLAELRDCAERGQRLLRLKRFTEDETILENVDSVAFNQEELNVLLRRKVRRIYLCGDKFQLPLSVVGVSYIGINKPMVIINSKEVVDWAAKQIILENVSFDDKYQSVINDAACEKRRAVEMAVDRRAEIADVVRVLTKKIDEFLDSGLNYYGTYETDNTCYCNYKDYETGGFESEVKARAACKRVLAEVVDDALDTYSKRQKKLLAATEVCFSPVKEEITNFVAYQFPDSYATAVDLYCSASTKEYLLSRLDRFRNDDSPKGCKDWEQEIAFKSEKLFLDAAEGLFDDGNLMNTNDSKILLPYLVKYPLYILGEMLASVSHLMYVWKQWYGELGESDFFYAMREILANVHYLLGLSKRADKSFDKSYFILIKTQYSKELFDTRNMLDTWQLLDDCSYAHKEGYSFDIKSACGKINAILNYNMKVVAKHFPKESQKAYNDIKVDYANRLLRWLKEL